MSFKVVSRLFRGFTIPNISSLVGSVLSSSRRVYNSEESMSRVLWLWGVLPSIFFVLLLRRLFKSAVSSSLFFRVIMLCVAIVVMLYFLWHIISIRRKLKLEPELDSTYRAALAEKSMFDGLNEEEIVAKKAELKKANRKLLVKKVFLLAPWGSFDFYKLVACVECILVLDVVSYVQKMFPY